MSSLFVVKESGLHSIILLHCSSLPLVEKLKRVCGIVAKGFFHMSGKCTVGRHLSTFCPPVSHP